MPTGSIKVEDIKDYLKAGATAVGVGRALYFNNSYDEIKETVKEAVKAAESF